MTTYELSETAERAGISTDELRRMVDLGIITPDAEEGSAWAWSSSRVSPAPSICTPRLATSERADRLLTNGHPSPESREGASTLRAGAGYMPSLALGSADGLVMSIE